MATKTFKIGEYAIGGKIQVVIDRSTIRIAALDYNTGNTVLEETFGNTDNSFWPMKEYLWELTSSYYTDLIMDHIEKTAKIQHQMFKK
jgi:hypothetical protein